MSQHDRQLKLVRLQCNSGLQSRPTITTNRFGNPTRLFIGAEEGSSSNQIIIFGEIVTRCSMKRCLAMLSRSLNVNRRFSVGAVKPASWYPSGVRPCIPSVNLLPRISKLGSCFSQFHYIERVRTHTSSFKETGYSSHLSWQYALFSVDLCGLVGGTRGARGFYSTDIDDPCRWLTTNYLTSTLSFSAAMITNPQRGGNLLDDRVFPHSSMHFLAIAASNILASGPVILNL